METNALFEEIRPYRDEEVQAVLAQVSQDPALKDLIHYLFPNQDPNLFIENLKQIKSVIEFQTKIIAPLVFSLVKDNTTEVKLLATENIHKGTGQLFISNHRDIILDAALLNSSFCLDLGYTGEIAIGDNLFVKPWIEHMVKLNRSFVVKRNLAVRQQLEASKQLSQYIRNVVTCSKTSCWLAQREGRAKDSNDRTQESLLKMLNLGGTTSSVLENILELNICPLTFSYEFDPCDYLKAQEFQEKRDNPDYKKSPQSDMLNMQTGIKGWKGRVYLKFSPSINDQLHKVDPQTPKTEIFGRIAEIIDRSIHSNYILFPHNYIALDLLEGTSRFTEQYTAKDLIEFEQYIQGQMDKITLEHKDEPYLRNMLLTMYANPTRNYLAAVES